MVLNRIRAALETQGLSLQVEDLNYRLWSFQMTARKLAIRSTAAPDLPEFLSADELVIHLSLLNLIRGKYEVDDATITNARIHLLTTEDGRTNLPSSSQSTTESTQWFIHKLISKETSLTYEDRRLGVVIDLPVLDVEVDGNSLTRAQEIQAKTLQEGQLRYGKKTLPVSGEAGLSLESNNQNLAIERVQIASGTSMLEVNGRIDNLRDPALDLNMSGNAQLATLRDLLSIQQRIDGNLKLEGTLRGPVAGLKWEGHVAGDDLVIERWNRVGVTADLRYDDAAKRITVSMASIRSAVLNASATGTLEVKEKGRNTFTAQVTNANLAEISKTLKFPVVIASSARGSASAQWTGTEFSNASGSGRLQLSAHRMATPAQLPLSGAIRFNANRGNVNLVADHLAAGETVIDGTATLTRLNNLGGELRVHTPNAQETLTRLSALSGNSWPADVKISGPIDGTMLLGGTVAQPRVDATLASDSLDINELKQLRVHAEASATKTRIDVHSASAIWKEHIANLAGHVDLTGPSPSVDFQANIPAGSLAQVLAAAGRSDIPATGSFVASAQISGTTQNPIATLSLSVSDLQAYGEALGTLTTEAQLENQVVHITGFKLQKDEGTVSGMGEYDIRSKVYNVTATGHRLAISSLKLPKLMDPISGRFSFSGTSSGVFDNPSATISLTADNVKLGPNVLETASVEGNLQDHQVQLEAKVDTDISRIEPVASKEFAGRLVTTVSASGDIRQWESGRIRAQFPNLQLIWRNQRVTSDTPFELSYRDRVLTVSQATLRMGDSEVTIAGSLPLDRAASGEIRIEALGDLSGIANILPSQTGISAEGRAILTGTLRGNLKRLEPDATLQIMEAAVETPLLPAPILNLNANAVIRDGRITVSELSADWAVAKIKTTGSLPLSLLLPDGLPVEIPSAAGNALFSADVDELRITTLPGMPDALDGTVSGHAEISAPRLNLNSVEARIELPKLDINVQAYRLDQVGTSVIAVRNGIATIEQFELTGARTSIKAAGTAALYSQGALNLTLDGTADAALVSLFSKTIRALGDVSMEVAVRGTRGAPQVTGFVEVVSATVSMSKPSLAVEGLNARVDFNGTQMMLTRLEGLLNGGDIEATGSASIAGGTLTGINTDITVDGTYLEFPRGLRTLSSGNLTITGSAEKFTVGGSINIINGSYSEPFALERGLLRYMATAERPSVAFLTASPYLSRVNFDLAVKTSSPLVIENDIAKANVTVDLELKGTASQPGLTGQIDVEEGAELRFRERRYVIERGVVRFTNDQAIEPILDIMANTRVNTSTATYEITMQIQGNAAERIETVLTSTPALSESDIVLVLATGRTRDQLDANAAEVAQEQVLSYLASTVGTGISREVGRAIGLSQVRIEPSLIANEANPTARLTLGQDLTPQLNVVYSMDLLNSSDQIWIGRFNVTRYFTSEVIRQSDGSYRGQFQHDLYFGGLPAPYKMPVTKNPRTVGTITFTGNQNFTTEQLLKAFKVKSGSRYDFFKVRDGLDNIATLFRDEGYLEGRVFFDRKERGSMIDLNIRVREGTKVDLVYEGWEPPKSLKKDIVEAWQLATLDAQRVQDATALIRAELMKDHHLSPIIDTRSETPNEGAKRFTFTIVPGMRYSSPVVAFEGLKGFPEYDLHVVLKSEGYLDRDFNELSDAVPSLQRALVERGYLDAVVQQPTLTLDAEAGKVRISFRVIEGRHYTFYDVEFVGNASLSTDELLEKTSIHPHVGYMLQEVLKSQSAILKTYRDAGYNQATVEYVEVKDETAAVVEIIFKINEGKESVLVDVHIEGSDKTSMHLVRTQLGLNLGDPVSSSSLSKARNNLYSTGAYSLVDIDMETVPDDFALTPQFDRTLQLPVRLTVRVREVQPYQFRYGGYFDTTRGFGGIADLFIRNLIGSARVLGFHARYDKDLRDARIFFSQPSLRRLPLKTVAGIFFSRSRIDELITRRAGATANFEHRYRDWTVATFGYRIERARTFDIDPSLVPREQNLRIATLTGSLTRDTRNHPLDASTGSFTSNSAEWAATLLGSQTRYLKYFGQYARYHPMGEVTFVPWAREFRDRYVFAWSARLGLAGGLAGDPVPQSEKFFSGGATTVRAYDQNHLGPRTLENQPLGGNAMIVLNAEMRFPLYKFLDSVAFLDAGNVFSSIKTFDLMDLSYAAGTGIRVRTPWVLLRVDYGVNLQPRPGELRSKLYFSIGQAF